MLFARNLEVMIRSGMQILESLEILKKQAKSKTFVKILDQLIFDLKNFLALYQNSQINKKEQRRHAVLDHQLFSMMVTR